MPRARAFITGADGFVGGFLLEHLAAEGDELLGAVPRPVTASSGLPDILRTTPLVVWDLADPSGDDRALRTALLEFRPRAIYHLAAISVPEDCGDAAVHPLAQTVNVEGTARLLRLAAGLPQPPRVLIVSSSYVYPSPGDQPRQYSEADPVAPRRGYGRTKREAELLALEAWRRDGLPVLIARAFPHTGPRQSQRMMLPEWAAQFAAGIDPVRVHTLEAWIDLSDVRDVVRAYRLLVERGVPGEVYNVGSGLARRSGDVFELLRRLADPARGVQEIRPGRKCDPIADIGKIRGAVGWRPEIALEQTVRDTWEYWRSRNTPAPS
ncbi:MAG: NAD-dependent epimerase/dehydratase family protein [Thermogutta sp.]|nr:NAD-dependent epimerase/dehydratase family protein [Thermogutta sp.]